MEDGPPRFPPDCTCPAVLGYPARGASLSPTGLSPAMAGLPRPFVYALESHDLSPTTPAEFDLHGFRLVPVRSPLLGESLLISFRPGTKMFQFPGLAASRLCIHRWLAGSPCAGFPIRRSPDHSLLAASRSFSQLSTSFFASDRLGIHRAPFVA